MKFTIAALFAAGAMAASLEPSFTVTDDDVAYTTMTVTAITTYCPEATEITMGETTYTVTEVRRILWGLAHLWEHKRKARLTERREMGRGQLRTKPRHP